MTALAALCCGCASPLSPPARTESPRADGMRAACGIDFAGDWKDAELMEVEEALASYPGRDFSGVVLLRELRSAGRGGQYDRGRITIRDVSYDVLIHELGHAVHSRCPGSAAMNREIQGLLPFDTFASVSAWEDGSDAPRNGFVSPYAAMNVHECVAESLAAVKTWVAGERGALRNVDWHDDRYFALYEILSRYNLLTETDWAAIRRLRTRR